MGLVTAALAAGAWLALGLWLVLEPGGRSAAALVRVSPAGGPRWRLLRRPGAAHGTAGAQEVRVAVAQVVALLRAGAPSAAAWSRALGVPVDATGLPDAAALAPALGGADHARSIVAAAVLARDVGAPLAGVLDAVSEALVAEAEARAEREASLAGPRATARVLMWLPALGALLGWALGADPLSTALDGGAGTAAVALGLVLLALGRVWTGRLVAAARTAGEAPR